MKKKYSLIAVLLIAVILVFGCLFFQNRSHEEKEEKKTLRVGVTLYRGDDSFINNLCGKMEEKAKAYEKETGPTCAITTRIMQTPLVKSTKSIRLLWLPSIISFNFSFSAQRYFINRNKKRNIEKINE